jgi:hypothetical protein
VYDTNNIKNSKNEPQFNTDSKLWTGNWILNQEMDIQSNGTVLFDANQCLHANWYGVTLFNKTMDAAEVDNEFKQSRARFSV